MSEQRERFEAWAKTVAFQLDKREFLDQGMTYKHFTTEVAWLAWQAACPEGFQAVPKRANEKMIVDLMCTGLRHAEYVTGRAPTVSEMQQGYQFMLAEAPKPGDA